MTEIEIFKMLKNWFVESFCTVEELLVVKIFHDED